MEIKRIFQEALADATCQRGKYTFVCPPENKVVYNSILRLILTCDSLSGLTVEDLENITYEDFDFTTDLCFLNLRNEYYFFSISEEEYLLLYLLLKEAASLA